MNRKFIFLLALALYAASAQASDVNCLDRWERDHRVNYETCTGQKTLAQTNPELSSCIDKWERDHSSDFESCSNKQESAGSTNQPEHSPSKR